MGDIKDSFHLPRSVCFKQREVLEPSASSLVCARHIAARQIALPYMVQGTRMPSQLVPAGCLLTSAPGRAQAQTFAGGSWRLRGPNMSCSLHVQPRNPSTAAQSMELVRRYFRRQQSSASMRKQQPFSGPLSTCPSTSPGSRGRKFSAAQASHKPIALSCFAAHLSQVRRQALIHRSFSFSGAVSARS